MSVLGMRASVPDARTCPYVHVGARSAWIMAGAGDRTRASVKDACTCTEDRSHMVPIENGGGGGG